MIDVASKLGRPVHWVDQNLTTKEWEMTFILLSNNNVHYAPTGEEHSKEKKKKSWMEKSMHHALLDSCIWNEI